MEYTNLSSTLNIIGELVRDTYKGKLKAGNHVATGKLYNSIDYKLTITDDNIHLYFIAENYYINIENGRKANSKMPPLRAIQKWMVSRGIKDIGGTGYLISRSIGKKGIKANPYLREIKNNLKNYRNDIEEALAKDIKEELENIVIKYKNK